jgi:hypothetical protein
MKEKLSILDEVLNGLMSRYMERVPDVGFVINAMKREGIIQKAGEIENDHIAFRTLGVPHLGISSFEKIFLHYGYQKREHYYFRQKKLDAYWYAPPADNYPRIFVSELMVDQLSKEARDIIQYYTSEITSDPVDALDLNDAKAVDQFLHSPLWRTPSLEHYEQLAGESEYAAWVIYNRYYLNHFTVSVHNLKEGYNTVESFNRFLESNSFLLYDSGGKIKISPDQHLLQSSTVARMVEATFSGGETIFIPGSYVEFAERKALPRYSNLPPQKIKREHRRDGFEAGNADKIFVSTYTEQTQRL